MEDFITSDFIDYIIQVEGNRKKRGKHFAYKSAEGGSKTIGYGHKIKKGENFSSGLTENQAKLLLESDLMDAAQGVQKSIGKDWDTLDENRKQMLIGMQFNLGSVKRKFPKFTEAVIQNDVDEMRREYRRYFKPTIETGKKNRMKGGVLEIRPDKQTTKKKELTSRNEAFFNKFLQGDEVMDEQDNDIMTLASNEQGGDWQTIPDIKEGQKNREKNINDELQRQMHPDAQKEDAFSSADVEGYFANSDKTKKAIQNDYRSVLAKGMKLIHGKDTRENLLRAISTDNPVDSVANITVTIMARIGQALRQARKTVSDEVKAIAANNLMGQILEVGEASGTVQLDDDEKELAFSLAINKYMDGEIKAGRMDPKILAEETGRSVANMDEAQRKQIDEQLNRINDTAMASNDKYGFKPQGQQGGGSMLGGGGMGGMS